MKVTRDFYYCHNFSLSLRFNSHRRGGRKPQLGLCFPHSSTLIKARLLGPRCHLCMSHLSLHTWQGCLTHHLGHSTCLGPGPDHSHPGLQPGIWASPETNLIISSFTSSTVLQTFSSMAWLNPASQHRWRRHHSQAPTWPR